MIHTSPWPLPPIPAVTLTEHVAAAAERFAGEPALIDGTTGTQLTYAELVTRIRRATSTLADRGVGAGDVVALIGSNTPEWVIGLHGALAAGATVSPLNPALTADELGHLLRTAGAVAIVADPTLDDRVERAAREAGVRSITSFDALDGPDRPLPPPVDPASVAVLPFSSGTTGLPKGVQLTHANLVANLEQHRVVQRVGPGEVFCAAVPFFHSYGLTLVLHNALVHGAAVVTLRRFAIDPYVDLVREHGVTRLHVAPPVLRALADRPVSQVVAGSEPELPSVRVAVCGAAPLDPALAEAVASRYGFPVVQGYGLTEASPGTHFTPDDRWRSVPAGSVGWLVPGTEGRIGAEGDLWVRGPQVMAGYLDAPEATAATIDPDGWLRTGDVVTVDGDGAFRVVDRVKELIKYNGYQVPPAELEAVLMGHPQVRDAAVVGVPDPTAGELPKAFVVGSDDLDTDELLAWVAERVAPYKKIRLIERVDAVPRSAAGKILRRVLRDGR